MKKAVVVALVSLGVVAALLVALMVMARVLIPSYQDMEASILEVDPSSLPDGEYEGVSSTFPVKVRLRVSVAEGRMEGIELLEHFHGRGEAAEAIIPKVLQAQSVKVDAISGATHSSLTILKAVEKALEGEEKE